MKNLKILKKTASICITAALLVSAAAMSSFAAEAVNLSYSYRSNLASDQSYYPNSFLQGFFQVGTWNHNSRAGTHYNAGSVKGQAFVEMTYVNRKGKTITMKKACSSKGTGWRETPWQTVPNDAVKTTKIKFYGKKYLAKSTIVNQIVVNGE